MNYIPGGTGWELWSFPLAGGEPTLVRGAGLLSHGAADTAGYEYRVTGNSLIATRRGNEAFWVHPAIAGTNALVTPSPDGRWLAIQQKQDIYLAPVPRLAAGDSLVVDLSPNAAGLRRLTREGGMYARWRNPTT